MAELRARGADDIIKDVYGFVKIWNEMVKSGMQINIEACTLVQLPEIYNIEEVNISLFIMRKAAEDTNYFYRLLENVQFRQNSILNNIYEISSKQQSHSDWIQGLLGSDNEKQIKSQPMHKIHQQHILKSWNVDSPQSFCIPGLYYSKGNQLYSDLVRFERELISDILRDKLYIDFDRTAIFEHKVDMPSGFINDLSNFIEKVEQEQADNTSLAQLLKKLENIEESSNLLHDLVGCVRILKCIGGNCEKMLVNVLRDFSLIGQKDKRKEDLLKSFRLKHIKSIIDAVEESILDKLVQMCLPCYKAPIDEIDKKELKLMLIDIKTLDISACIVALGRYIVRLLSNEADGEKPNNYIFYGELFWNNDWIPGIEELWPDKFKEFLQNEEWNNEVQKYCKLKRGKALHAFEYLRQYQSDLIKEKISKHQTGEQKQSDNQELKNQFDKLNEEQKENFLNFNENQDKIGQLDDKNTKNYDLMGASLIKQQNLMQQSIQKEGENDNNLQLIEQLPSINIIKTKKQVNPQSINNKIQQNLGDDNEENIVDLDDENDVSINEIPQNSEIQVSTKRGQQELKLKKQLSAASQDQAPLPNIAKLATKQPKLTPIVKAVIEQQGEFIPKKNYDEKFQECKVLPAFEFINDINNLFQGFDFQINQEVDIYVGQWRNGKRWGQGKLYTSEGGFYHGYWINDKMSICGRFIYQTGDMYEGEMDDNQLNGQGTMYHYEQGIKYHGEFVQDEKHGKGTMSWSNGAIYEGEFQNNNISGYGKYTFPDKRQYEGNFLDNKYNGEGKFTWPNGKFYKGNYKNCMKQGYGEFMWQDSTIYKGQWENNQRHGEGLLIDKNGIEKKVIYKNDILIED